jgi:hypothetical protein
MESGLTKQEKTELEKLCAVIEDGLSKFLEVGKSLMEINKRKLYRETHDTFEAFVSERWGISRQRAYQLMDAADVKKELSTSGCHHEITEEITNERQLRELSKVGTESLPDVVEKIAAKCEAEGCKPTAKVIKSIVDEALEKEPKQTKPVKPEPVKSKADEFELRCRRILGQHATGMRLQLSNLGYSDEFEKFLDRIDEIVENG